MLSIWLMMLKLASVNTHNVFELCSENHKKLSSTLLYKKAM